MQGTSLLSAHEKTKITPETPPKPQGGPSGYGGLILILASFLQPKSPGYGPFALAFCWVGVGSRVGKKIPGMPNSSVVHFWKRQGANSHMPFTQAGDVITGHFLMWAMRFPRSI